MKKEDLKAGVEYIHTGSMFTGRDRMTFKCIREYPTFWSAEFHWKTGAKIEVGGWAVERWIIPAEKDNK